MLRPNFSVEKTLREVESARKPHLAYSDRIPGCIRSILEKLLWQNYVLPVYCPKFNVPAKIATEIIGKWHIGRGEIRNRINVKTIIGCMCFSSKLKDTAGRYRLLLRALDWSIFFADQRRSSFNFCHTYFKFYCGVKRKWYFKFLILNFISEIKFLRVFRMALALP